MDDDGILHPREIHTGQEMAGPEIRPSTVKLPERPNPEVRTIFEFFLQRFPRVAPEAWSERFASGKVWAAGQSIDRSTPYQPLLEVHYRREVVSEPPVREDFRVVWSNEHLMVVDKPPFLPVTPGGRWVRNCLLHLLVESTGNCGIAPLHRLDRLTSGVMLLSLDPATRSHFSGLFQPESQVRREYTAVCEVARAQPSHLFRLRHHIARSPREYWRQIVVPDERANADCEVEISAVGGDLALVRVRPATGRKHQLRVQLAEAGLPILGDPLYGNVRSYDPGDLSQRLWLDAHRISIHDFPLPGKSPLKGSWVSSRSPAEFFDRAVRSR